MGDNDDDQESVTSEATQRTTMEVGGVLKTKEDYVVHAASLRKYSGERLRKANVRYPADAQRAFEKYASSAMLHYDRDLSHAKALHAYNVDLREFNFNFATIKDAKAHAAAKGTMATSIEL